MNVYTVCAFGIFSAVLIAVVRQLRPELASLAAAVAGVVIFAYVIQGAVPFIKFLKNAATETGVESYFTLMLKALTICICCKISSDICRDCGEVSLASRVELAGRVGIIIISLPIVQQLLEIAKDMLN